MNRAVLLALVLAASARGQTAQQPTPSADADAPQQDDSSRGWGVTLRQRDLAGNQSYWLTDTFLDAQLPHGLELNADFNAYRSNASTMTTPTTTFGGGWTYGDATLFASYALTGRANDMAANAADVGAAVHTADSAMRTTLSVDVSITHQLIYGLLPPSKKQILFDMTERTPTATLTQRFFDAVDAAVSLSESKYNNLSALEVLYNRPLTHAVIAQNSSVGGLVQGFPDWSATYSLKYAPPQLPLTLKASYEAIQFVDTNFDGTHNSADVQDYTAQYDFLPWLTLGVEYQHYRQTALASYDQYGGSAEVRF